jgi:hypothetical protein
MRLHVLTEPIGQQSVAQLASSLRSAGEGRRPIVSSLRWRPTSPARDSLGRPIGGQYGLRDVCIGTLSVPDTRPCGSRTMAQFRPAISQARKPALTESKIIARSRAGKDERETWRNIRFSIAGVTILACLPGMVGFLLRLRDMTGRAPSMARRRSGCGGFARECGWLAWAAGRRRGCQAINASERSGLNRVELGLNIRRRA